MLEKAIIGMYDRFKLHFYKTLFEKFQERETSLTAVETFCIEIIYAMGNPTVSEFANFIQISSPNAAYKVNSLCKKGYLKKVQSSEDKREFYLQVTDKYMSYYNLSADYVKVVSKRMQERFSDTEIELVEKIVEATAEELMPEIGLKPKTLE